MGRSSDHQAAFFVCLAVTILVICCQSLAKETNNSDNNKDILDNVQKYASCIIDATFSFLYPTSYPPKTKDELKSICRHQTEGFKCLKERTKGSLPLIRRGLVSYVTSRQKHHKKYCTNLASEQSREFLEATKCLMEKKFSFLRNNDAELAQKLQEIARRNFTDPNLELKHFCCSFYTYKKNFESSSEPECSAYKAIIEELSGNVASEDMNLVCEEEEKLAKTCAKLEPLQFKRLTNFQPNPKLPTAALATYLVVTLGEPNDSRLKS